jgi:hypothetical protein
MMLAVVLCAWPLGAAGAVGAPTSTTRETPKRFVGKLAAAVRTGDAKFLLRRLDPAVIDRYRTPLCRGYVSTLKDPTRKLVVLDVGAPGPFTYASDGASTTVPATQAVTVRETAHGATSRQIIHIARHGKQFTWFTTCHPSGADAVARAIGPYTGTYIGTWRDTHFNVGGDMTVMATVDAVAHTLGLQLGFTGSLFGATAPSTEQLAPVSIDVATFGQPVSGTSKIFGPYTVTYTATGTVTVTMPQCPPGSCTLTGTLEPGTFTGTVSVALRGGGASQGTVTLKKQ